MFSRRVFLGSVAGAAGSLTAGCVGFGQPRFENQCEADSLVRGDATIDSVMGGWPQYQHDHSNAGFTGGESDATETPAIAWRHATCDPMHEGHPSVEGGTVYVTNNQRPSVYAFDAVSGEVLWTVEDGGGDTAPAVVEDTLYIVGEGLLALDTRDRTERWRAGKEVGQFPAGPSPTVHDGIIYVGGGRNPVLNAFDAADGTRLWDASMGGEDLTRSVPAVMNGLVLIVDDEGTLHALDAADGAEQWTLSGVRSQYSPVAVNGQIYVAMAEGGLREIGSDGSTEWTAPVERTKGPPAVTSTHAFVTTGEELVAVDLDDGTVEWTTQFEHPVGTPTATDDTVYLGQEGRHDDGPKGRIIAVNATTGQPRWRLTTRGIPTGEGGYAGTLGSPAVVDGAIYATTGAGDVLAIGPME